MPYDTGRNGCDHHRLLCQCDFCGGGQPLTVSGGGAFGGTSGGVPAPNDLWATGLPRPRHGEGGHPASATPHGLKNWDMRQAFFGKMGGAAESMEAFTGELVKQAART
jgi:hypothetical protein